VSDAQVFWRSSDTKVHKLQLIAFVKQHLPWLVLSALLPLIVVTFVNHSAESISQEIPTDPPPLVAQLALYPGFIRPPVTCYRFRRWPNTIESCDFRMDVGNDSEVTKFYNEELKRQGWKLRDANGEGWKSPTMRSFVLAFYSRGEEHFFLEKPIGEAEQHNVYRLLFTTILTTRRDPKE